MKTLYFISNEEDPCPHNKNKTEIIGSIIKVIKLLDSSSRSKQQRVLQKIWYTQRERLVN